MVFPDLTAPLSRTAPRVATAGEALIDLLPDAQGHLTPCAGGAVYNLTRALGSQGVPTAYLNPLSKDGFGTLLDRELQASGVWRVREQRMDEPTALAVVDLDAQGKASYSFYREGVADRCIDAAGLNAACHSLPTLEVVATGCLALLAEDAHRYQPWLAEQRAAGRLVVVDANLRPAIARDLAAYRHSVLAALAHAHLIKASDDDLVALGLATSTDHARSAAHTLLEATPATGVVLTLGARGAMWLGRDGRGWHAFDPVAADVVDTVGAGDCFLAGLLGACLEHPQGLEALRSDGGAARLAEPQIRQWLGRGIASAGFCVEQKGCTPPTHHQVQQRLDRRPVRLSALP
jgi:fructokinase